MTCTERLYKVGEGVVKAEGVTEAEGVTPADTVDAHRHERAITKSEDQRMWKVYSRRLDSIVEVQWKLAEDGTPYLLGCVDRE